MLKTIDNGKDALDNDHQHFLQRSTQLPLVLLFYLSGHQPPYSSLILYPLSTQTPPIPILVLFATFRYILEHYVRVFRKFVCLKQ